MRILKKLTTKKMNLHNKAWLAGFFDGEGSVGRYRGHGRKSKYLSYSLEINNTHLPSLVYCQYITGVGNIYIKRVNKKYKKQWVWAIKSQRNIMDILKQIFPFLQTKKNKVNLLLTEWVDTE